MRAASICVIILGKVGLEIKNRRWPTLFYMEFTQLSHDAL